MNDQTTDLPPFTAGPHQFHPLPDTDTRFGAVHRLRAAPPHFQATWDGRKTFEIRYDDRGYQAGDTVVLEEYDARVQCECIANDPRATQAHLFGVCPRYTRRTITAIIGWVQASVPAKTTGRDALRFYGNGWVIFSLVEPAGAEPLTDEPITFADNHIAGTAILVTPPPSGPSPKDMPRHEPPPPEPGTRVAYSTSSSVQS